MGKVILILSVLGVLLGGAVAIGSLLLPQLTRNVSMSEASIGIVAGAIVLILSFVPLIAGFVLMRMKKNESNNAAATTTI